MDEYSVLVDRVVRDALGLDGARGADDLPAEPLTAPAGCHPDCLECWWAVRHPRSMSLEQTTAHARARQARAEAGPSSCGE